MKERECRGKNIGERGDARFLCQFFFLPSPPMVVPLPPPAQGKAYKRVKSTEKKLKLESGTLPPVFLPGYFETAKATGTAAFVIFISNYCRIRLFYFPRF